MDLAALFFRALDSNGDVYLPYRFDGNWTDEEKTIIKVAIDPHVPEKVDAMFNNWGFVKYDLGLFTARRATWDMDNLGGKTVQELAQKIAEYYNR